MHIVHFDENMLIGDAADLDAFMEMYGVEAISKVHNFEPQQLWFFF